MIEVSEQDQAVTFTARVVARASQNEIVGEFGGALKIRLAAPPVDGAANKELVKLLSKAFGVSKSAIKIISGETAKTKQIRISNLTAKQFQKIIDG